MKHVFRLMVGSGNSFSCFLGFVALSESHSPSSSLNSVDRCGHTLCGSDDCLRLSSKRNGSLFSAIIPFAGEETAAMSLGTLKHPCGEAAGKKLNSPTSY